MKYTTCKMCNVLFSNSELPKHIKRNHHIEPKDYYDTYIKDNNNGKCKTCGNNTEFINLFIGYKSHCCKKCVYLDKTIKLNRQQTMKTLHGSTHWTNREKSMETTKKNGMYRTKLEDRYLNRLKEKYPDIVQHYVSDEYPFECDFYVPSLNLYIELNVFYLHNNHFFDKDNPEDIEKVNFWKSRNIDTIVWTVKDIIKRDFAIRSERVHT